MSDKDNDAATDLLIQEVDEDLRHEQYTRLWKQYGGWVVVAAVALVLGVAGQQAWKDWRAGVRKAEAARFAEAMVLADGGKRKEAADALAGLAGGSHTGYQTVAGLMAAAIVARDGRKDDAATAYDKVAASSGTDALYRDLATLDATALLLDGADPAALKGHLQALTGPGPWHSSAMELSAALAQREGDLAQARALYKQISDDAGAPQAMRARAAEMLAALGPADKVKG